MTKIPFSCWERTVWGYQVKALWLASTGFETKRSLESRAGFLPFLCLPGVGSFLPRLGKAASPPPKTHSTCLPHRVCPARQVQLRQFRPSAKCSISSWNHAKVSSIKPRIQHLQSHIPFRSRFVCHYYPEFQKYLAVVNNRKKAIAWPARGPRARIMMRTARGARSSENRCGPVSSGEAGSASGKAGTNRSWPDHHTLLLIRFLSLPIATLEDCLVVFIKTKKYACSPRNRDFSSWHLSLSGAGGSRWT